MQYGDQIGQGNPNASTWKAPTQPVSQTGVAAQPAPQAAAAPASDLKSIIPGSPTYLAAMAAADKSLRAAKDEVAYQKSTTYRQYGYLQDANGNIAGVDPNNPYGAYQQEKRSEAQQILQGQASARAGGWGQGGMIDQALQNARQGIQQGMYNQGQQLQGTLHGFDQTLAGAQAAHDQAGNDAFQTAWSNAIAGGLYDPVTGQPIPTADTGAGTGAASGGAGAGAASAGAGRTAVPVTHPTKATVKKILPKKKAVATKGKK